MKEVLCVMLICLCFSCARGEGIDDSLEQVLDNVDVTAVEAAAQTQGLRETVLRLARGETVWDATEILEILKTAVQEELQGSYGRMLKLIAPSLLCALAGMIRGKSAGAAAIAEMVCSLALSAAIASDLKVYLSAAEDAVVRMDAVMQSLFPLLLTLLAAVGATSGAALLQPAVAAAGGTMTTLVRQVSLPLALGMAVVTLINGLTDTMRLRRLSGVLRSGATWTLGIAFTVFIGVTAMQGITAGTADGVSIRAAKYAVDHFVPVVGGMFADTMDTLVGCSLLIKNALGVTGLMLLFTAGGLPMLRTLCAALMYRLCAALLQPVAQERTTGTLQAFSDVLTLLFVIQLSVGAMFLLLIAQVLAVGNATVTLR